jgi:hypothetical protein
MAITSALPGDVGTVRLMSGSALFVTLDSCRYDTFVAARAPTMKGIAPLHRAAAPGYFTFSSHMAMFMGFTPGVAQCAEPFINPKFAKVARMLGGGWRAGNHELYHLSGRNIVDGLRRLGYLTIGTAAMGWFDTASETGQLLTSDFEHFWYSGVGLRPQLDWLLRHIAAATRPVFAFLNVGETHVPYHYEGAPWDRGYNPCLPFGLANDADECRRRQLACVEWIDRHMSGLLEVFADELILLCADHGDCWGEDGLWEHGIYHPKVVEVPLLLRTPSARVGRPPVKDAVPPV